MDLLITAVAVAVFCAAGWNVRRGGPGADRTLALARYARAWLRACPVASLMWLIVCANAIMLIGLPDRLATEVLRVHSTNLGQFAARPLQSLITSALWIEPIDIVFATLMTLLVLGPAERWLGHVGMPAVYFAGSATASLVSVLSANRLLAHGVITDDLDLQGMVDVGVSYGSLCVAGLLVYRIPPWRWRIAAMIALPVLVNVTMPFFGLYATLGHLRAVILGYLLWPVTRIPAVRRRATTWRWRFRPAESAASPAPDK
ncbi:rhomboid-like protein [Tsukamurella sp. 1534]|uniref:rhomboid-like protein n=1 Tax=Tsukamurella sp. 1534 TaxID=1151061 RepID=UPI0002E79EA5|nr:rhomboid-like protein [Tsukamurella sp. 1534]